MKHACARLGRWLSTTPMMPVRMRRTPRRHNDGLAKRLCGRACRMTTAACGNRRSRCPVLSRWTAELHGPFGDPRLDATNAGCAPIAPFRADCARTAPRRAHRAGTLSLARRAALPRPFVSAPPSRAAGGRADSVRAPARDHLRAHPGAGATTRASRGSTKCAQGTIRSDAPHRMPSNVSIGRACASANACPPPRVTPRPDPRRCFRKRWHIPCVVLTPRSRRPQCRGRRRPRALDADSKGLSCATFQPSAVPAVVPHLLARPSASGAHWRPPSCQRPRRTRPCSC